MSNIDSETRTAQLILKGTLHEMDLSNQILVEDTLIALRDLATKFPDSIEFATTLFMMELSVVEDAIAPPDGVEIHG